MLSLDRIDLLAERAGRVAVRPSHPDVQPLTVDRTMQPRSSEMSHAEVERFAQDLKAKPALLAEIRKNEHWAAGVSAAARHGYDFTLDEAKAFVVARAKASGKQLSDSQLDN